MEYDREMIIYVASNTACVHDDFGNLIPLSWDIGMSLIMFLLSDNEAFLN